MNKSFVHMVHVGCIYHAALDSSMLYSASCSQDWNLNFIKC